MRINYFGSYDEGDSMPVAGRQRRRDEPEVEFEFWRRYRQALRVKGVKSGLEI
jgi:hypothetical protein